MSKRISKALIFTVAIAVVALFAATQAGAKGAATQAAAKGGDPCTDQELEDCTCFQDGDFVVRLSSGPEVICPNESSPSDECSTQFTYEVDCHRIKDILMLVPNYCDPALKIKEYCIKTPGCDERDNCYTFPGSGPGTLLTDGAGDDCSLFGIENHRYDTWLWEGFECDRGEVSLTFAGTITSACTSIMLRTSGCKQGLPKQRSGGQILGAACFASTDPVSYFIPFSKTVEEGSSIKHCEGRVYLEPNFYIWLDTDNSDGDCVVTSTNPLPVGDLTLGGSTEKATDLPEGWFGYSGSPTEYCYYNKKKKKYQCVQY